MTSKTLPYSYHSFLFPFIWNDGGRTSFSAFVQCLGEKWKTCDWEKEDVLPDFFHSEEERRLAYAEYQYFTPAARKAIYGFPVEQKEKSKCSFPWPLWKKKECPDWLVHNYMWNPDLLGQDNEKALYCIRKKDREYKLEIKTIKLKLYEMGIGVLVFELENYENCSIDTVNKINEYGRRIFPPFIADPQYMVCADRIELCFPPGKECEERKWSLISDFASWNEKKTEFRPIPCHIEGLFENRKGLYLYKISGKRESFVDAHTKQFYVKPIIDDRMFVICAVRDDNFIRTMNHWQKKGGYTYQRHSFVKKPNGELKQSFAPHYSNNAAEEMYRFAFIDGEEMSCPNRQMLHALLEEHIYPRWLEYWSNRGEVGQEKVEDRGGTFHAVTHHSMVCATGNNENLLKTVIDPFLTMYMQMAIFALVQRSAILAFSKEAAELASKVKYKIKKSDANAILAMQERYVDFQNRLLFFEVTAQEQGVEIYKLLQKSLYIEEEKDLLKNQMESLHELANLKYNDNLGRAMHIMTIAVSVFTLLVAILGFIQPLIKKEFYLHFIIGAIILVIIVIKFIDKLIRN